MRATILDGKKHADSMRALLKEEVGQLLNDTGRVPTMVNIIIGDDQGSRAYAKSQKEAAAYIGINYKLLEFRETIGLKPMIYAIEALNKDPLVHGIMIQQPVPLGLDYSALANSVCVDKDLEGINVANIGEMMLGKTKIIPCTPASVLTLIGLTGVDLAGKHVVIVGHSTIVGKPLSLLLMKQGSTVTMCQETTSKAGRLEENVRRAEVLIVAVGIPSLIKGDWIKPGAIVIDVGMNRVDGKLVGDVEFGRAKEKASFISPVPGGVGPLTVVMLMQNCVKALKMQME